MCPQKKFIGVEGQSPLPGGLGGVPPKGGVQGGKAPMLGDCGGCPPALSFLFPKGREGNSCNPVTRGTLNAGEP